jgi:multidrug efflux pump subunit AcrA (membrane-fusion protein)
MNAAKLTDMPADFKHDLKTHAGWVIALIDDSVQGVNVGQARENLQALIALLGEVHWPAPTERPLEQAISWLRLSVFVPELNTREVASLQYLLPRRIDQLRRLLDDSLPPEDRQQLKAWLTTLKAL